MNEMQEAVELPDPSERALLHPTEIPPAKPLFVRGWWFARAGSIPVGVALGALIWLATGSLMAAILAPAVTIVIGMYAGRWWTARAWDYVPRKRQRTSAVTSWQVGAASIDGLALILAATAFVLIARAHEVALPVVAFALGAGIAVGVVQGIELIMLGTRRTDRRNVLPHAVLMAAVLIACLIAAWMGIGSGWHQQLMWVALLGAGTIVLAQALWSGFDLVRSRWPAAHERP